MTGDVTECFTDMLGEWDFGFFFLFGSMLVIEHLYFSFVKGQCIKERKRKVKTLKLSNHLVEIRIHYDAA